MQVNSNTACADCRQMPAAKAPAHGVVRKLGTNHFNAAVEAKLAARFAPVAPDSQPQPPVVTPTPDIVDVKPQPQATETPENAVAASDLYAEFTGEIGIDLLA